MKIINLMLILFLFQCNVETENIEIIDNYSRGIMHARKTNQKILLIFDTYRNPTMSTDRLLANSKVKAVLQNYTVINIKIDDNIEIQKFQFNKYLTNYNPSYFIIDSEENILKGPLGYCNDQDEFIRFIIGI